MIKYPDSLPRGLHNGRSYQTVSPLKRSELSSGRARQRRNFTSVPTMASISWIFNSAQAQAFEAWWRDQLIDGSQWFECPLETPLGYQDYTARFTDIILAQLAWAHFCGRYPQNLNYASAQSFLLTGVLFQTS